MGSAYGEVGILCTGQMFRLYYGDPYKGGKLRVAFWRSRVFEEDRGSAEFGWEGKSPLESDEFSE